MGATRIKRILSPQVFKRRCCQSQYIKREERYARQIAVCSGTHQVGRNDELGVHLALRIYFETDCPPTNEALEQQEGNSRDTGDDLRQAFELVTASGWFYLHGPILKQSA